MASHMRLSIQRPAPQATRVSGAASTARRIAAPPRPLRLRAVEEDVNPLTAIATDDAAAAEALDSSIAEFTRAALQSDPEAAAALKRYEDAVVRLEKAKAADRELEKAMQAAMTAAAQEDAAAADAARLRADQVMADAEVEAAQRLLRAAEIQYAAARGEEARLQAAAGVGAERLESAKAAALAALGAGLGAAPLTLLGGSGAGGISAALSLLATLGSAALFGITYRYAVRDADAGNSHLRGGVVAAFGLAMAAGAGDAMQAAADGALTLDVIGPAALYAGRSMLAFGFAATALEAGLRAGAVRRFGGDASSGGGSH